MLFIKLCTHFECWINMSFVVRIWLIAKLSLRWEFFVWLFPAIWNEIEVRMTEQIIIIYELFVYGKMIFSLLLIFVFASFSFSYSFSEQINNLLFNFYYIKCIRFEKEISILVRRDDDDNDVDYGRVNTQMIFFYFRMLTGRWEKNERNVWIEWKRMEMFLHTVRGLDVSARTWKWLWLKWIYCSCTV